MPLGGLVAWAAAAARAALCPPRDAGGGSRGASAEERWGRLAAAACRRLRVVRRWAQVVRGNRRLAFKRRQWGHLGQWLRAIKLRGQEHSHPLLRE